MSAIENTAITTAKMKSFFEYAAIRPSGVDARKKDGRVAAQVCRAFLAPSVAAAIRLIDEYGWNRSYVKAYIGVDDDIPEHLSILSDYEPGTILIAPLDPGDTIDGSDGWRPYVKPS